MVTSPYRPRSTAAFRVAVCAGVAVAALIGGGWWLLRGGAGDDGSLRNGAPTSSRVRAETSAHADSGAEGDAPSATRAHVEGAAESGLPPCEPGPPDGIHVRAFAREDGRPLPGARVYVVPSRSASRITLSREAARYFEDPSQLAAVHARGVLADERGVARITWPPFEAVLVGFAEGHRGAAALVDPTREEIELPLARAIDLSVQVVDAKGSPVPDARVACASRCTEETAGHSGALGRFAPNATPYLHGEGALTDAHGIARVEGVELVRQFHDSFASGGGYEFGLVVPYLGRLAANTRCDVVDPDRQHGLLSIPLAEPFGILEVRVVDARDATGASETIDRTVTVRAQAPNDAFFVESAGSLYQTRPVVRGVARFAPVALGSKLEVGLQLDDNLAMSKIVDGPKSAGETARVEFDLSRTHCVARGRFVGLPPASKTTPNPAALEVKGSFEFEGFDRNGSVHVDVFARPGMRGVPCTVRANADATFDVDVRAADLARARTLHLDGFDRARVFAFHADVDLPNGLAAPVAELGDVAIVPRPVVAWGRVVDDLRQPIANVQISAMSRDEKPATSFRAFLATQCDAAGRFALFGESKEELTQLVLAPPSGYAKGIEAIPPDGNEMECVLTRTGTIVGSLAADRTIHLFAVPRGAHGERSASTVASFDTMESVARSELDPEAPRPFVFELRPGRYDLLASTDGSRPTDGVVLWLDDFEVRPAEATLDPRLSPLAIPRALTAWKITLKRSDGSPPPSAWVRLARADDPAQYWRSEFVATGESSFESTLESAWIDVDAISFRRVHELHARGEVAIVLEPVDQRVVEVALDAGDAPHGFDLHWIVAADSSRPQPGFLKENYSTTVLPGGTSRLALDEGERWTVRLFAQIDAGGNPRHVEVERCMQEVSTRGEKSETPAKLSFTVHLDEVDALWQDLSSSK